MKAIILAAGQGARLAPYTNDRPKCLVELGGHSLLQYALANMRKAGIEDINIVTGYMRENIRMEGVHYFYNELFATTNMVESLFCAEAVMDDDIVISYGDIIFQPDVLQKLIQDDSDMSVIIDNQWQKLWELRSDDPLQDAETLKLNENNFISEIGAKPDKLKEIQSQYIGLLKFSAQGIKALKETFYQIQARNKNELVIRGRAKQDIYMTDMIQLLKKLTGHGQKSG